MSFVVFVGCKYWGMMMSDTRSLNENKEVSDDNAQKIYRINDNNVIATAGYTGLIYPLIEDIILKDNNLVLTFKDCSDILINNVKRIEKSYKEFSKTEKINTGIGLMGINNGIINFLFISFIESEISISMKEFTEKR